MKLKVFLLTVLTFMLSACNSVLDTVPDTAPQVSVATINGLESRKPQNGIVLAPAAQLYDPNSNTTVANSVPVGITSSDERQVVEVTLILRQGSENSVGDIVYTEIWRNTLSADADEEIFRNPFNFVVPFRGAKTGLVPAELEVIATDDKNQDNPLYQAAIMVDGSLPLITATVPTGPVKGKVNLFGSVADPESGIRQVAVFIDGTEVTDDVGKVTTSSFSVAVDTTALDNGVHALFVVAVNGVNETAAEFFTLNVSNNAAPLAQDDVATTDEGVPVTIDVLANDTDEDGDALKVTGVGTPGHGTAKVIGEALVEYTPEAGFSGTDTFAYTLQDSNGAAAVGKVAVTVGTAAPTP